MKKYLLLFKRACAVCIDGFIIGLLFELCKFLLPSNFIYKNIVFYLLVIIIPYCCKDIVFTNASVGKLMVGLVVVDNQWNKPSLAISIKRTFLSGVVGGFLLYRAVFVNENYIAFFDYERDVLKARVIDKKLLKELEKKAKTETGINLDVMTKLYDKYLLSIYKNRGDF